MKKIIRTTCFLLINLLLGLSTISYSQNLNTEWEKFSNTEGLDFYADVIEDVRHFEQQITPRVDERQYALY